MNNKDMQRLTREQAEQLFSQKTVQQTQINFEVKELVISMMFSNTSKLVVRYKNDQDIAFYLEDRKKGI